MLKVVFMLECDHCHEPLERLSVSLDHDCRVWEHEGYELEECAFEEGWTHCYGEDGRINGLICQCCQMTLGQPSDC